MIETQKHTLSVNHGHAMTLHKVVNRSAEDILREMKRLALDDHPRFRLPAPNPVSIERKDLPKIKTGYVIAEKTDGVRFVLCCLRLYDLKLCVLVDRAGSVFLFPLQCIPKVLFQGSIFDGELTFDKLGTPHFVLFDAVVVSGVTISHFSLEDRLVAMHRGFKEFRLHPHDPASLTFKRWIQLEDKDVLARLRVAEDKFYCDGYVLMPKNDQVVYGRHFGFYKLKPEGTHTVDFMLLDAKGTIGIYDPDMKKNVPISELDMSKKLFLIGTIIECAFEDGRWVAIQDRPDKTFANDMLTYQKTLRNIAENITISEIISA